jgi:hypothetical protein
MRVHKTQIGLTTQASHCNILTKSAKTEREAAFLSTRNKKHKAQDMSLLRGILGKGGSGASAGDIEKWASEPIARA